MLILKAHVLQGRLVLDEPVELPEGAKAIVMVGAEDEGGAHIAGLPTVEAPERAVLPAPDLVQLHNAAMAVAAIVDAPRSTMLAGIAPRFLATLMTCASPAAQILSDLHLLNRAGRLNDGSVPLATWLTSAARLAEAEPSAEAEVFRAMLASVREWEKANPMRA